MAGRRKRGDSRPMNDDFILSEASPFHMKEAYTTLRTNILFSLPKGDCKVIAVTSANESEGKSTNCLNLAISFGQLGKKVLIMDCDQRRPNVSRLMGKSADEGISNVLVGMSSLESVIRKSDHSNLDVIFAGEIPPNPTELLGSEKMSEVIKTLNTKYEYIFIDTPPVCAVPDTAILGKNIDGVAFVVKHSSTDRRAVAEAVRQLEFGQIKILGFILANITSGELIYGKQYKKKYGYAYGYGSNPG